MFLEKKKKMTVQSWKIRILGTELYWNYKALHKNYCSNYEFCHIKIVFSENLNLSIS